METDGLVGLTPNKIGSQKQDMLVEDLYNQGKIKSKGFSMYIGNKSTDSKLWIGTYVTPTTNDYGSLQWMRLSSVYHWQVSMSNVVINGISISLKVSKDSILDSGTSLTYIPSYEF